MIKTFLVDPIGKPRMTKSDKWKKRDCVERYWAFKDAIQLQKGDFVMPASNFHAIFHILMPRSWSKKKRRLMNGKPHQVRPDRDNIEKALLDALCLEDSYVWDGRTTKVWAEKGKIEIIYELSPRQVNYPD